MADFVTELGDALATAFRADATLQSVFPDPAGSTSYAIEYNAQRTQFLDGVRQGFIRPAGRQTVEDYEDSARTIFRFEAWFQVVDPKGANNYLDKATQGVHNVLKDKGVAVLDTHLVDSASNRLHKSGEVRGELVNDPLDDVNPDQPIIRVDIEVELTHADPLA